MNNTLEIPFNSELNQNLNKIWWKQNHNWHIMLRNLDDNITETTVKNGGTIITFNDEIAKTFFILKYS